jgi:hypothetical protein
VRGEMKERRDGEGGGEGGRGEGEKGRKKINLKEWRGRERQGRKEGKEGWRERMGKREEGD